MVRLSLSPKKHRGNVNGPADFRGFVLGVPFPYSMHNLLLRYYLATGGINPDTDVTIRPVPPPDSIAQLVAGDIDGFLMPDPFNQRAVFEGAGFIYKLTKDIWDGHPCCAFAASDTWISDNPNTFRALNKAIIEATDYARVQENRVQIAEAISGRAFLNQPVEVVQAVLTGNFEDGLGNTFNIPDRIDFDPYPWQSFANWITSQLVRWDISGDGLAAELVADGNYDQIGQDVFFNRFGEGIGGRIGTNSPLMIFTAMKPLPLMNLILKIQRNTYRLKLMSMDFKTGNGQWFKSKVYPFCLNKEGMIDNEQFIFCLLPFTFCLLLSHIYYPPLKLVIFSSSFSNK